jgi:hypothetical protein
MEIEKRAPSKNPWAFDVAFQVETLGNYWLYPTRSNHPNPDGTADGENMLFGDGHVQWVDLDEGGRGHSQWFGKPYGNYAKFHW